MELELLLFYLASVEKSPESYLAPSGGCLGAPGGRHDIRSLWGLYKMHETLWFCLVSDRSSLSWGSVVSLQDDTLVCLHDCLVVNETSKFIIYIPSRDGS